MTTPEDYFDLSCPEGGDVYICEGRNAEFVGCCTSNPCGNQGICPKEDLKPMTFSKDKYEDLPPMNCLDEGLWYSCAFANPPFVGCCTSNPCVDLYCPAENLTQGVLTTESRNRESFLSPVPLSTATSSSSSTQATSSSTGTATNETPSTSDAPLAEDIENGGGSDSSLSTGAIAGIVVGSVLVAVVCVGILMYRCGWSAHRKKTKQEPTAEDQRFSQGITPQMSPYHDSFPPGYSGYYTDHYKQQSPQMGQQMQFGSPNTMVTEQTMVAGGWNSRHTSGDPTYGMGIHVAHHEPQELPASPLPPNELPAGEDGRLYQYHETPTTQQVSPSQTPMTHFPNSNQSPHISPLLGIDDIETLRANRRSRNAGRNG